MTGEKESQFVIQELPRSWPTEAELLNTVTKSREFRLLALRSAPNSIASTYEQETGYSQDRWIERLQNPNATQLVLLQEQTHDPVIPTAYQVSDWSGGIVIVKCPGDNESKGQQYYHLNGLFVKPEITGQGLGKKLVSEALAWIDQNVAESRGPPQTKVVVDTFNKTAIALYLKSGFAIESENEWDIGGEKRKAFTMWFRHE